MDKGFFEKCVKDVAEIYSRHEDMAENEEYNIFSVLGVDEKEVIMCRFLASLLQKDLYAEGDFLLKSFFEDVLKEDYIPQRYVIETEHKTDNNRRIDIVIRSKTVFIAIEVKIYAGEEPSQCYDYLSYAKRTADNYRLYYLSLYGDMPSSYSLKSRDGKKTLGENDVKCISFKDDIVSWLEKILPECKSEKSIFAGHFCEAIKTVTDTGWEECEMEKAEYFSASAERMRAAAQITDSFNAAKAELLKKVFSEFELQMNEVLPELGLRRTDCDYYEYNKCVDAKWFVSAKADPGLSYVFKKAELSNGYQLWFRVAVDHRLYCGFALYNSKKKEEVFRIPNYIKDELADYINLNVDNHNGWWLSWFYLPTGSDEIDYEIECVPNFKHLNEAAISLADDDYRKEFVAKSIELIKEKVNKIIK